MALRQTFFRARKDYLAARISSFPLHINLRDHHGQSDPDEALERHARRIGYPRPHELVRAWRVGLVLLILDGFDELATAAWVGRTKKLKQIRHETMTLVRRFVQESKHNTSIVLAGRSHYFDNIREMIAALGVDERVDFLTLNEFTEDQLKKYFQKKGVSFSLPDWLPGRPLLIGYLVSRKLIDDIQATPVGITPSRGWHRLLTLVSQRESAIEANIDADAVREIIERITTKARAFTDGLGPVYNDDIGDVFRQVVGYPPDDKAQMSLMRLPGLGATATDDNSRHFIDQDIADAARAGDVIRFCSDPYNFPVSDLQHSQTCIGAIGTGVCAALAEERALKEGQLSVALRRASELEECQTLAVDVLKCLQVLALDYSETRAYIDDVFLDDFQLMSNSGDYRDIFFQNCAIQRIDIDYNLKANRRPRFQSCIIDVVDGRVGKRDLPDGVFDSNCEFFEFSDLRPTTSGYLELDIPNSVKVLLVLLKKLFLQPGRGRRESALYRGLDQRLQRYVPELLELLHRHEFATPVKASGHVVWLPVRAKSGRVIRIMATPSRSRDEVVRKAATL